MSFWLTWFWGHRIEVLCFVHWKFWALGMRQKETQQGGRRQTARTWGPPRCQGILSVCPLQQLWGARPALGVRWDWVGSLYFYLDITVARGTFSAFDNHFYTSPLGSISLRLCFPEKQTSFDVFRWLFFFKKSHGEKLWAPLCHRFPREQR